ncbi:MAG: hypothetical protein KDA61_13355 [Planctomycetales bacterium]|nr:hypothetical protein [Planctomycetales bacterium]
MWQICHLWFSGSLRIASGYGSRLVLLLQSLEVSLKPQSDRRLSGLGEMATGEVDRADVSSPAQLVR